MNIDITAIIVIALAIVGLWWIFPKLPEMARFVVAILVVIVCLAVILKYAGVPIGFS